MRMKELLIWIKPIWVTTNLRKPNYLEESVTDRRIRRNWYELKTFRIPWPSGRSNSKSRSVPVAYLPLLQTATKNGTYHLSLANLYWSMPVGTETHFHTSSCSPISGKRMTIRGRQKSETITTKSSFVNLKRLRPYTVKERPKAF